MAPRYEADIAAALGKVVEAGLLYRERKSIRWCWHCRTALAEAELEYTSRRDPEITRALAALGRNGVPVYVLHRPGKSPLVLPEVLQAGMIHDALSTL